jgi:hypothetical protein
MPWSSTRNGAPSTGGCPEHRAAMGQVLEHGTWPDRADIDALLDLPLPGVDELVGMMEIARLAEAR